MNLIVNSVQLAGQGGEMEQRNGGGRGGWCRWGWDWEKGRN